MAAFYFFTEPDILNPQTEEQPFGPVTATQPGSYVAGKDRYRITNWHKASADVKAFAISGGIVCVQPAYDELGNVHPGLVNLILKSLNFTIQSIKLLLNG